ncbi:glutaredoxin family protein [Romboutsia maritimum]|uniref:Glutaredoxin family protein n=1 Tax=Romboutsia maritimum TaxID=2020948 RepID=A0A371IPW8_9FIRM|nr:glutaredoxin family protein [Romboutsia maritimum]RDY22524.1 glutaredoxin family protein [Romboutsia maritimum]
MNNIEIYTSDTCINCIKVKEYFKENEINFTEKNISKNSEQRKELIKMGYMSVPVLIINGEHVLGFDLKRINELLNK